MLVKNFNDPKQFVFNFHNHPKFVFDFELAISSSTVNCSDEFIKRLANAYTLSVSDFYSLQSLSVKEATDWEKRFFLNKDNIHSAIYKEHNTETLKTLLSDPYNSELWRGFEMPTKTIRWDSKSPDELNQIGWNNFDKLYRLAEAINAVRIWNPENKLPKEILNTDILIKKIEKKLGIDLYFPYPYPHMFGLKTYRGIIGYRTIWGLYCAWLISRCNAQKVLEIGAGLGWVAYHASKFNVKEYYIVDIPLTALASSHFLGLACGENNVTLYGEKSRNTSGTHYKILPPNAFPTQKQFDLVINIDSMTEMAKETAENYIKMIKQCTKRFISINHEGNPFTVAELLENDPDVKNYTRKPFWVRQGYVEEVYEF